MKYSRSEEYDIDLMHQANSDPVPTLIDSNVDWIVNSAAGENASLRGRLQDCIDGIWNGRSLAWRLFVRNLQGEYRQSLLGWFWIFLPALANAAVWVLLNSSGTVRISSMSGFSYAAFVFLGTVLWQGFTDGLMSPMNTLQSNRSALTKLPFPKEVFVLVSLMETGFDLFARSLIALVLLAIAGLLYPIGVLALLVCGPMLVALGVGVGLILAPFGLLYKDVSKSLTMMLPVWMLLTPVIYPMPTHMAGSTIAWLNPPAALIHVARNEVMGLAEARPKVDRPDEIPTEQEQSSAGEKTTVTNTNASSYSGRVTPESVSFWVPAAVWGLAGLMLVVVGTVWLRVSSPIIIERLAN